MKIAGKMSTFGGPSDQGVAADEGLALIEPRDLSEWWFGRLFLSAQPANTTGLARRLNPDAFYIAMRWGDDGVKRETARRAIFRLTNPKNGRTIFAQAADFGPGLETKRAVDMSPGAAQALDLTTDDSVEVEMLEAGPTRGQAVLVAEETSATPKDPRSEKNIATLLPNVQPTMRTFLRELNERLMREYGPGTIAQIISGTRTNEEQDALYAQGRTIAGRVVTNARGGYSNHNYGIAVDIGIFHNGRYLDDGDFYDIAGEIGQSLGLEWGGAWESFCDRAHFEERPSWAIGLTESNMVAELRRRTQHGEAIA
jgi:peptidoglycan L-alanyl-D-glutamate endopeptidase CwlK